MLARQEPRRTRSPRAKGEILPQGEPIGLADIRDALIIKEGDLFLMTDAEGDLLRESCAGYGFYKADTRYLSVYDLTFDGVRPTVLFSNAELGHSSEQYLTNPAMMATDRRVIPKDNIEIRRRRLITNGVIENLEITNFSIFKEAVKLRFDLDADFSDIFEVRGEKRAQRGVIFPPEMTRDSIAFKYEGLDGVTRRIHIKFSSAPDQIWRNGALFNLSLEHRESKTIVITISPDDAVNDGNYIASFEAIGDSYTRWLESCTQIHTDNAFVNAIMLRSLSDIRMLTTERNGSRFIAAGTPWFNALFGRDSVITAYQMLPYLPEIAASTLRLLAQWQGDEVDEWRDEEPGKILHELRVGEMAALGEIPMHPYYGSVDSTPLFLMLAAYHTIWTGDLDLIRQLEGNIMAALNWIDNYGDFDKCGYTEYFKRSSKGIINQGWKDSRDGIINADGTLVKPPIALAEVQGYVYAAKRGMSWVFSLLGNQEMSRKLRREANALKISFNRDFWSEDEQFYAVALGANKEKAMSITSNPGQCFWTGIIDKARASKVVDRLFNNDVFSGWGIRTLSSISNRYNPLGYHLGTVWPHDNSIIGIGLKRYGFEEELNELATALYDCCHSFDYYRLPELFSGNTRSLHGRAVRYPVACRPQAWAAGTFPMLMRAILGIFPDAITKEIKIARPMLPYWLKEVEVKGLRVGDGRADLVYRRHNGKTRVSVTSAENIRVSMIDSSWPRADIY